MRNHLETYDAPEAVGPTLGQRVLFLIAGAVLVAAAQAPLAALAARIIG